VGKLIHAGPGWPRDEPCQPTSLPVGGQTGRANGRRGTRGRRSGGPAVEVKGGAARFERQRGEAGGAA
jgi:hypothetical protein